MPYELPSGEWEGFWTEPRRPQESAQDNSMKLRLYFNGIGEFEGEGQDRIGTFQIIGNLKADNTCNFTKAYSSGGALSYLGESDHCGISGGWVDCMDCKHGPEGNFYLWPLAVADSNAVKERKEKVRRMPDPKIGERAANIFSRVTL